MPPPNSPQIPIDPALALYPPYYTYQQPQHIPHHLALPQNLSSPSSQGSDTIGTPPTEHVPYTVSNMNGKRPSSSLASGTTASSSRKKARKDDEDNDGQSPATEKEEPKAKPTRGSRACTVCRRLKMKCVGAEQGPPCKRCVTGNHECIFEESNRGKRSSKKHELLTRSLRKMERTLDTVLRSIGNPSIASGMVSRSPSPSGQTATTQALIASPSPPPQPAFQSQGGVPPSTSPKLHSLPDNALNPLGLLAEASLANRRAQGNAASSFTARPPEDDDERRLGVASDNYFKPGPMTILPLRRLYIERQVQPEMLSFVSTEEVVTLFDIYFDHINMHCNLFDRDFHTPSLVCSRSPFLLTTICAIASKFYNGRPELHAKLTELAKKLAFSVPARGYKSLEIVQAYLLLTLWGSGAVERYEQDKTWMMLGMAIRMATDLNLHRKTAVTSQDTPEGRARDTEVHNRERTWFLCFALDRSASAQMGKPHSIKEDFIIRNALQWCRAPVATPGDMSLASYVELQRIVSRSLDFLYSGTSSASGLQTDCDYLIVIKTIETQIFAWEHEWTVVRPMGLVRTYSATMQKFYFHYYMLVINSFGLQNAMERSAVDIGHFFARCHTSATAVAVMARDELAPRGYLKYSPDSHFVFVSYAVLSLLKLIRPEFQPFLENDQKIFDLVKDVVSTFEGVAVNSHHTPALYSTFLRALISARTDGSSSRAESQAEAALSLEKDDPSMQGDPNHQMNHQNNQGTYSNSHAMNNALGINEFQFESEMGPVADITTFPPTMAVMPNSEETMGMLSMDSILSTGFWDSVLVPGYSDTMEGISGGFVFGAGGSGLITPRWMPSPLPSGTNTPSRGQNPMDFSQQNLNVAFQKEISH
ncbi:hypothetical protein SERLADRAFT_373019 [Serpula lacrymans var. lacrymans S7.9]|uniref:Zn(2)-C6 fungal-type domain-containing protein n=1 Tax=Serpula lacrymans var. lacrymans (strain S7.9) TaxID=578457 RepID=F8P6Z5_SERL9|nr:uncharacterized protein SERLADRAFT_373019 [Serpula lacrymans var. lacrymans S7.9]EGO21211.1 hypothetical protein SERLADRAFT_373019 [Serpula lacrymans var. lacrymans S7.9]